jgi:oxygen-independent coproporphyrinogen-3 oxidase
MDLILGLPGETPADVEDTMKKIIALGPDDITLHALALKKGSRLKRLMEEEHVELPSDEQTRRMSEIAVQYIEVAGMHPYYLYRQGYMSGNLENIGCCRPGAEGRYNIQIMEEHQTVLGIGGAAASKIVFFDEDSQKPLYMKSCFHAKDLAFYEKDIDKYIEKRAELLKEAYGD